MAGLILVFHFCWLGVGTFLNKEVAHRIPTIDGYNETMFQSDLLKLRQQAGEYADGK